ncbi:MAG: polysaccharide deacetylase family protein [Saccharofermentanales bacterium]|jgi:peptidoglycan/xylan/chitin deacetylase (PgdA/CDA1 family)
MNKVSQERNIPKIVALVLIGLLVVTIICLVVLISQKTKSSTKFIAQYISDSLSGENSKQAAQNKQTDPANQQNSPDHQNQSKSPDNTNQHLSLELLNNNSENNDSPEQTENSIRVIELAELADSEKSERSDPDSGKTDESGSKNSENADTDPDTDTDSDAGIADSERDQPAETTKPPASEIAMHPSGDFKYIALTFDDGPYDKVDLGILDLLNKYEGHATFFLLGGRIDTYPDTVKAIAEQGSELANHSYNHKNLTKISYEELLAEINLTNELIQQCTGITPALIRPPYGAYNDFVLEVLPYPFVNWNHDTEDWSLQNADLISQSLEDAKAGSVILMHSLYPETLEALEKSLPILYEQGYRFVTVSELYRIYGVSLIPHGLHKSPTYDSGIY